jgi:predicted ribosomally synthesized peptide with SipW-like signal peptide
MKKKIALLCVASAMVAALAVGGTLAYLTDRTDTATNTFAIGEVKGKVLENGEDPEGPVSPGGLKDNLLVDWDNVVTDDEENVDYRPNPPADISPGQTVQKAPRVQNTGKNAAYVRLSLGGYDAENGIFELIGLDTLNESNISPNWEYHEGYYYYIGGDNDGILLPSKTVDGKTKPGETTPALFTGIKLKESVDNYDAAENFSITVYAELIQADFLNLDDDDELENAIKAFANKTIQSNPPSEEESGETDEPGGEGGEPSE